MTAKNDSDQRVPWETERKPNAFFENIFTPLWKKVVFYIIFRRNMVRYMRYLGVQIGPNCSILNQPSQFGTEPWLIEIGSRVTITEDVMLVTHDGSSRLFRQKISGNPVFGNRYGVIKIQDDCFIGARTIILPDVTIGPNSIVGAGSLVNRSVEANSVYAGVPARYICSMDEYIEKYKSGMIQVDARTMPELRTELTAKFFGKPR